MKTKRSKPFPATLASRKMLEADNWTVGTVESQIPHTFIKRDLYGFADLIAMSPTRGIMLVQVTGSSGNRSNYLARVRKVKESAEAGIWLASGGRIQVHSWEDDVSPSVKNWLAEGGDLNLERFRNRWCRILEIRLGPSPNVRFNND
jgi:hypothetical protein